MTAYPGARWAPLGAQTQPQMTRHDIVCLHTMVGYLISTDGYFRTSNGAGFDGTESHFGVGGKWGPDLGGGLDGRVWQWQDLDYTADANLEGNWRVISIETADNAERPIEPWTAAQLDSIVALVAWLCARYDIPAALVPDTQASRRGIAYHAQGARDWTAGEWWSTSPTKDCPTDVRIAQLKTTVIPRVQRVLAGGDWFDMATEADLASVVDARLKAMFPAAGGLTDVIANRMGPILAQYGIARTVDVRAAVQPLLDDQPALTAVVQDAVAKIPGGEGTSVETVTAAVRAVLSDVRLSAPAPLTAPDAPSAGTVAQAEEQ